MGASWAVFPVSLDSNGLAATAFFVSGVTLDFGRGLGEEDVLRRSRRDLAWTSMLEVEAIEEVYRMGEEKDEQKRSWR
jgi:hypothetical protein